MTLISYAGSMNFGFVGNGVALPGLERLATHTREAFAALRRAAARRLAPAGAEAAPTAGRHPRKAAPTREQDVAGARKKDQQCRAGRHRTRMNRRQYTQIGVELSLYSGKTRSYLRHKRIPFVERATNPWEFFFTVPRRTQRAARCRW